MPNVVWIHGQLECGGLLDGPAALKGIQRQQGIVTERYGTAKEGLRNIRVQVVAKQLARYSAKVPRLTSTFPATDRALHWVYCQAICRTLLMRVSRLA